MGTGGTITGTARYLKEQKPDLLVVGADPEGSIYSGDVHPYLTEGIGEDFWPTTFDPSLVDRYVRVSDRDAFRMARGSRGRRGSSSARPRGRRSSPRSRSPPSSRPRPRWS